MKSNGRGSSEQLVLLLHRVDLAGVAAKSEGLISGFSGAISDIAILPGLDQT